MRPRTLFALSSRRCAGPVDPLLATVWTTLTWIMMSRIQTAPTTMVMRVNVSPAREPKALEPPAPPKRPGQAAALAALDQDQQDQEQARDDQTSVFKIAGEPGQLRRIEHGKSFLRFNGLSSPCRMETAIIRSWYCQTREDQFTRRRCRPDDGQELIGLEAGAADQGAVHVGLAQQRGRVVRLDAAAVLNRKRSGRFLAELLAKFAPRMKAWASWACSGVALRPVPMAQTGS